MYYLPVSFFFRTKIALLLLTCVLVTCWRRFTI
jgi:hypothetical protein